MKRPTTSKEHPAKGIDANFMDPLYLKNNQLEGSNVTKKQYINSAFVKFRIICTYAKWWQTEKSKQMSEPNKAEQKNIEKSLD